MDVRYLFDSQGGWIAFKADDFVFDRAGRLLGWTPWEDDPNEVVSPCGEYVGTVVGQPHDRARFYRFRDHPYRGYPGRPTVGGHPGYPGHPGNLDARCAPPGCGGC